MSEDVMRKHIELYVNNYSLHLGEVGKKAVEKVIEVYNGLHNIRKAIADIFVEPG